ncbi:bifunctional diguanylate cyclase/phosphodiesterase, partial [Allisonella histaminiformans]|uniref:bifunctional diguanylate cyclase/phosphodiesterase n=1 Tax=Allisonella histaminiformans TaxID=209880 RepID=UPI00240A202A
MNYKELSLDEAARWVRQEKRKWQTVRLINPDENREIVVTPEGFRYGDFCQRKDRNGCDACWNFRACHMEEKVYARIRKGNQMLQIRTTPFRLMTESGVQVPVVMECMHSRPATGQEMNRVQSLSSRRNTVGQGRDSLTGLLNKRGFCRRVRKELMKQQQENYVIITLNIHNFRLIGELYGEGKANRVLMILAGRIREGLSDHSYAARIYGDEFAIFCRSGGFQERNLKKLLKDISLAVEKDIYHIQVHAGVYAITAPDIPVPIMINHADMARKSIIGKVNRRFAYYNPKLMKKLIKGQRLVNMFKGALERGEFTIYLQPQVNRDKKVVSAEVLARWITPDGTAISPAEFIPVLENSGQIVELDRFIWEEAARLLKKWMGTPLEPLTISVNVSPQDFEYMDVVNTFISFADTYGIDRKKLKIEITESSILSRRVKESRVIDRLVDAGFQLEIDDFGKGYSSLNTLKDINARTLKLDMAFLQMTDKDKKRGEVIIESVIQMG